jgi:hypothetical protein
MTHEKKKTPKSKDAESQFGNDLRPAQRREQELDMKHKNEKEKGSGEGVTGMQRGAGHPTGR